MICTQKNYKKSQDARKPIAVPVRKLSVYLQFFLGFCAAVEDRKNQ